MPVIPTEGDFEDDTVTIPVSEYLHLLSEVKFLRYLEYFEIEKWSSYAEAIDAWRNDD